MNIQSLCVPSAAPRLEFLSLWFIWEMKTSQITGVKTAVHLIQWDFLCSALSSVLLLTQDAQTLFYSSPNLQAQVYCNNLPSGSLPYSMCNSRDIFHWYLPELLCGQGHWNFLIQWVFLSFHPAVEHLKFQYCISNLEISRTTSQFIFCSPYGCC